MVCAVNVVELYVPGVSELTKAGSRRNVLPSRDSRPRARAEAKRAS